MDQVLRRWWWRFVLLASAFTLVLGLLAGLVLRALHAPVPAWVVVPLTFMGAVAAAGFLLPGAQNDLRRLRRQEAAGVQRGRKAGSDSGPRHRR